MIDFDFRKDRIPFVYFAIGIIIAAIVVIAWKLSYCNLSNINDWEDVGNYYHQSMAVFDGLVPYKDFTFEYPPFMLIFICFPMVFSKDPAVYVLIYMLMTVVFYILSAYFMQKIAEKLNVDNKMMIIIVIATMLFLLSRVMLRNDIFAVFFIIVALYLYLEKKYTFSFILISLGVMTKLFPIVIAFAFIIPFIYRKRFLDIGKYIIVCVLTCLAVSLPFIIVDSGSAFAYLTYHTDRGLQVESVAASIVDTINLFVGDIAAPVMRYGSCDAGGPIPDAIAKLLVPIMAIAFISILVWCYYKRKDYESDDDRLIILLCAISILIFVVFNKVFSAQYMLWIMMLVALVISIDRDMKTTWWLFILSIVSLVFTHLLTFPYLGSAWCLEAKGTLVLLVRNIAVVAIFVICIYLLKMELDDGSKQSVTGQE